MPLRVPPVKYDLIRLKGGLDQVTPTLALPSGVARAAANFEASVNGGYTRIAGYERFDGRPNPSDAVYNILVCELTATPAIGATITGAATGATGKVIAYDGANLVVTRETSAFVDGEQILDGSTVVGQIIVVQGITADGKADAEYRALAADDYREDIQKVPGDGPILGVAYYNNEVYAFRNNIPGSEALMYRATSSGWQLMTTPTLAPGGRYEFVVANFGGGTANYKLYGCDGMNKAFCWDGTTFTQITTGMAVDTPNHIAFHKQHLFLSFGASLQFSALGDPFTWTPISGAGEIAMNDDITNLLVMPGDQSTGALGVISRHDTSILYGTDSTNFQLSTFNTGTGALPYTAQNLDQAYMLSDRGVIGMNTTLNYGNFTPSSLTMNIRPFVQARRNLATASCLNREKGQYRVFFSDATAIYLTMVNSKLLGAMPVQFLRPVLCITEGIAPDGTEYSYFGSDDGYVYRLDSGTSFDGKPIAANFNLVFNSEGAPRVLKRYRKASVEMSGDSYAEIAFGYDLGYRVSTIEQPQDATYSSSMRSGFWDNMNWDNFVWDGAGISPNEIEVNGTAENMSIRISSVSAILQPFTVNNIIVHYTPRRGLR